MRKLALTVAAIAAAVTACSTDDGSTPALAPESVLEAATEPAEDITPESPDTYVAPDIAVGESGEWINEDGAEFRLDFHSASHAEDGVVVDIELTNVGSIPGDVFMYGSMVWQSDTDAPRDVSDAETMAALDTVYQPGQSARAEVLLPGSGEGGWVSYAPVWGPERFRLLLP